MFWATPALVRDLDVLMRCGHVQEAARAMGRDTPAGWFQVAANAQIADDEAGRLGRVACELVSLELSMGVAS
jgi:hypothetical protein